MKIEVDYAGGDDERNEITEDFVAPLQTRTNALTTSKKPESEPDMSTTSKKSDEKPRPKKSKKKRSSKKKSHKLRTTLIITFIFLAAASGVFAYLYFSGALLPEQKEIANSYVEPTKYYSALTGEELSASSEDEAKAMNEKPTFCVQIPNGLDGARPQVGLNKTAVVFEAIAEAGITRFAAVFQPGVDFIDQSTNEAVNSNATMLGPVRSLRSYYLDWDTPFDCTIVHAGGSPDAVAAVSQGYRDLSESTVFMWRDRNNYSAPNNLFTSSELLTKFNSSKNYKTSDFSAFPRITPDEETEALSETEPTSDKAKESASKTSDNIKSIKVNFGPVASFNTVWSYNSDTNSYLRAYATGIKHDTYTCNEASAVETSDQKSTKTATPTLKSCQKEQVRTKNLAVMIVKQAARAGDKKLRTDVATVGSGKAYVFKNGQAIKATWEKKSKSAQIIFKDSEGNEITFNPGRLWIQAVPTTGSVKY